MIPLQPPHTKNTAFIFGTVILNTNHSHMPSNTTMILATIQSETRKFWHLSLYSFSPTLTL